MSSCKLALVSLACLAAVPSEASAKPEVFYKVLGARVETPQKEDWIDFGTINASDQSPEVTKREVDKAVKRAFDDGAKRVKVQRQVFTSPTTASKPEDLGEVTPGKDLPASTYLLPGENAGAADRPQPPEEGKPKPEKWEMWLEEKKDGQWVEIPDRRYPYTDYEQFARAFADYDTVINGLNRNAVRYRLMWKAVEAKQPKSIETPEIKTVDLGPMSKPKSDFKGGTFGKELGYDGHRFLTLNGDGTGTLKMAGQGQSKRAYDIKWSLTEEGWVDIEKVRITSWSYDTSAPNDPLIGREASRASFEEQDASYFSRLAWKVEPDGLKGVWTEGTQRGKPAEHGIFQFPR